MYDVREEISALYCLFRNGLIDRTELQSMREYVESLVRTNRPTTRRASARMSSSLS